MQILTPWGIQNNNKNSYENYQFLIKKTADNMIEQKKKQERNEMTSFPKNIYKKWHFLIELNLYIQNGCKRK